MTVSKSKPSRAKPANTPAKSSTSAAQQGKSAAIKPAKGSDESGLVRANLFLFGAIFLLATSNVLSVWYGMKSKTEVIAITESGAIMRPVPLPEAFVTDSRVLSFVESCIRDSFSHDFENFRRSINNAKNCYTSEGATSFITAFEPSLKEIQGRRLVMSASTETPVVVNGPYLSHGRATWEVQSVITLYFQGTKERFPPQKRVATIKVVRVPLEEKYSGIGVDSIQLAPYVDSR